MAAVLGIGIAGDAALAAARRLKELRLKRGLRQVDVAVQSGLNVTTISYVEQTGRLTLRTARLLAPVLGVKVEELIAL